MLFDVIRQLLRYDATERNPSIEFSVEAPTSCLSQSTNMVKPGHFCQPPRL